jgi:glutathione S-transferase
MALPELWQFRVSHYNDKARWALDYKGVRHVRHSLLPGLHIPRVLWMTGQKSVPVLVMDGRRIADSTRIIAALEAAYPEPPLYPADEGERRHALVLEDLFDEQLGPHVRRALFHEILPATDYAASLMATGVSPAARVAYRAAFPAIRTLMRLDMGIDDEHARRSREKVEAGLDRIERELGARDYLVGDRFTVADLTAAALLSPLVAPDEYPYPLPGPYPPPAEAYRRSFDGRRALEWAGEMYRRHRGVSTEIAA